VTEGIGIVSRMRGRILGLALLAAGAGACGTILGIGDPILENEGGTGGDAGRDATSGGGNVGRDARADGAIQGEASVGDGASGEACATGQVACASGCTDPMSDPANCSSCGHACPATETCLGGSCTCVVGQTVCASGCSDTSSDPANCGRCGNACPADEACTNGSCGCPTAGQIFCGNSCTNPVTDSANCGQCGHTCVQGQSCVGGSCQCPTGETFCQPSVDGGAPDSGGAAAADAGDAGTVAVPTGYCANLQTDPSNCDRCGATCPTVNDTPACVAGACTSGTCAPGFADCNHVASDGCEVYTQNDSANCGSCGHACGSGELCSNSTCVFTCPAGQTICHVGGTGAAYCATLPSDPQNCGTCEDNCTTVCVGNVAGEACSGGTCGVGSCAQGYYDIDGICSNGCECKSTTTGTCTAPVVETAMTPGQQISINGNLVPAGTDTYYRFTFTGNGASNYHPRVTLAGNPGSEYVFDVMTNRSATTCGTSLTCGTETGTHAAAVTDWEVAYAGAIFPPGPNFIAIPAVGSGGTVIVHVYRASGAPVDCNGYTLVVNN
jgi:hypothetical protein